MVLGVVIVGRRATSLPPIIQAQAARRAGGIARSEAYPCEEALALSQGNADIEPSLHPNSLPPITPQDDVVKK